MVKHLWRRVQMIRQMLFYMVHDEWFAYVFWRPRPGHPGEMVVGFHTLSVSYEDCARVATATSEALAQIQSLRLGRPVAPVKL